MKFSSDLNNTMVTLQLPRPGEQQITYAQKQAVYVILSNYDSETFTQKDFNEIFSQFEDVEIPLGYSLKRIVEKAGFNFDVNIQQAIKEGAMPPLIYTRYNKQ